MAILSDLIVKLGVDATKFTEGLDTSVSKLDSFSTGALKAGGVLTGALTLPLVGIGKAAFDAANQLDEAMDKIRAGTGATGPALDDLGASFKQVFEGVPASADQVSTAITALNQRLDLTGPALEAMATQELNLARITGSEVGPLIELTTRMFGDWKIATDEQAGALDFLFKASQSTGAGVNLLSQSITQFGPILRQVGFDFEHAAALLGVFEQEGVDAGGILQSLNKALANMAKEGVTDAGAALQVLMERIKNAGSEAEARSMAFEVFGNRAGAKMAVAIREGRFEIDSLVTSLQSSTETINQAAADTLSFGERWDLFKNKLESALVPLGVSLVNALSNVLQYSQPLIDMLSRAVQWFGSLDPAIQTTGIIIGGLAAAIGPALVLIGGMATGLSGLASTAQFLLPLLGGLPGAISKVGIAAGVAGAAFAGWKLGEWLEQFTSNYKQAESKLQALHDQLAAQGVVVDRGSMSLKEWAKALFAADDQLKASTKTSEASEKIQKALAVSAKDLAAIQKLLGKETEEYGRIVFKVGEEEQKRRIKLIEMRKAVQDSQEEMKKFPTWVSAEVAKLDEEIVNLSESSDDLTRSLPELGGALADALGTGKTGISDLGAAMERLGVTSTTSLQKTAQQAQADYETIKASGVATANEILQAWVKAEEAKIEAARAAGEKISNAQLEQLVKAKEQLGQHTENIKSIWGDAMKQVSTSVTNAAQSIVGILIGTEEGSIWDAFKKLGQSVLSAFVEPALNALNKLIEEGLKVLLGWLTGDDGILGGIGKIGGALGDLFGIGGGAAQAAGGVAGGVGEAVGGATAGTGGGGGMMPGGATGLGFAIGGPIGGAIGAAVDVGLQIWQGLNQMRQETTLNAIEENTRRGTQYLGDRADGGITTATLKIAEYTSYMFPPLQDISHKLDTMIGQMGEPATGSVQEIDSGWFGTIYDRLGEFMQNMILRLDQLFLRMGELMDGTFVRLDRIADGIAQMVGEVQTTMKPLIGEGSDWMNLFSPGYALTPAAPEGMMNMPRIPPPISQEPIRVDLYLDSTKVTEVVVDRVARQTNTRL